MMQMNRKKAKRNFFLFLDFPRLNLPVFKAAVLTFGCCLVSLFTAAQLSEIHGKVKDTGGHVLEGVNIAIVGVPNGTSSDSKGMYSLQVPADSVFTLGYSFIGFETGVMSLRLAPGEKREINLTLKLSSTPLPQINIQENQKRDNFFATPIDVRSVQYIPSVSGNFEGILKTMPGVISNNELSSQYSVRGGNFDENLVYVNDIEIYRPFLVRSGQQEGLSFVNQDLVSSVNFSAGGFDAVYGDKMSSVLDIKYRRPVKFAGSVNLSLLGGGLHLEGIDNRKKWSYLFGFRHKSNQYLLKTFDTKGDYRPSFTDVQAWVNYAVNKKTDLSFLGNYSRNKYQVVPANRETEFGTINEALRFTVYFDGQEVDDFSTFSGALSFSHQLSDKIKLKLIASSFASNETEAFDIMGQYYVDELEKDLGSSDFGEAIVSRGVGTYINHARNYLNAHVSGLDHKGSWQNNRHLVQWGLKFQHESIDDRLEEWKYIDSAGFSLPQEPTEQIILQDVLFSNNYYGSNRYSAYINESWTPGDSSMLTLTGGLRGTYWDLNKEFNLSPRASLSIKPKWKNHFIFRFAAGVYYQPPFYREMRDLEGVVHTGLKAQRSIHLVAASDYTFLMFGREFKFVSEVYYKKLDNLVPYKVDNLRIRYYGNNNSRGYSTGIDLRLNGEFVPGAESWASLSVMKTQEDIKGDFYYDYYNSDGEKIIKGYTFNNIPVDSVRNEPGFIARPTDQRVTCSILFQDYVPRFPTFKMHMTIVFGTGLPFGPPGNDRYKDVFRYPSYRRVDIGFSKTIIDEDKKYDFRIRLFNHVRSLWISAEVFNLLQINNTVSYLWVTDVTGRQYAIPNYLTMRQLNIRLNMKF